MLKSIIALYGVPRSGTSWMGQIIDSCPQVTYRFQPLFSYRFKNRITLEMTEKEVKEFFEELYLERNDDFLNQTSKRICGEYPLFGDKLKDLPVLAYKEVRYLYTIPYLLKIYNKIKIIGIVRNPYDVIESWINAPSEYSLDWNIYDQWKFATKKNEFRPENYYGYYKWKEYLVMAFEMEKRYPNKFFLLKYEDLIKDPEKEVKAVFKFCGLRYTEQTRGFLFDSQTKSAQSEYGVYRNKNEKRKRKMYLPEDIKEEISRDLRGFLEAEKLGYK